MKQGTLCSGATALAISFTIAVASCAKAEPSITVDREMLLSSGLVVRESIIVRTPDGGFVVAGNRNAAWATRINAQGQVLWEYVDTRSERGITRPINSLFRGAIVLADNSVLLCGSKQTQHAGVGLAVRISPKGTVLAEDYLRPNSDNKYIYSRIDQCLPWGDSFVMLGIGVSTDKVRDDWMIKLNASGDRVWEKIGHDFAPDDIVEAPNGDLVLAVRLYEPFQAVRLTRLDSSGSILKTRMIKGAQNFFLAHSRMARDTYILGIVDWPETRLLTLDANFSEVAQPRIIRDFATKRAYVLDDQSLILFGADRSGSTQSAGITRISPSGQLELPLIFDPASHSYAVTDAAPINATQFAAVRDMATPANAGRGVAISWVSIK
jgi:hypothetical protein